MIGGVSWSEIDMNKAGKVQLCVVEEEQHQSAWHERGVLFVFLTLGVRQGEGIKFKAMLRDYGKDEKGSEKVVCGQLH